MRINRVIFKMLGTVPTRADASKKLKSPGDAVLIERGIPRWLLISCPCGCGEEFPINLDPRAGPAWHLYKDGRRGVSVFPSVWREDGCRSHYIIWRNKIYLFGFNEQEMDAYLEVDGAPTFEAVREHLPATGLVPFGAIAEALSAVPWDILMICRQLVRMRLAREGKGKQRGHFGRPPGKPI